MDNHNYTKRAYPCLYHGQWMDSLLELRYILSIENTHAWQRDNLQIYLSVNKTTKSVEKELRRYTPDFLIRNYQTGEAKLVEIKPTHFRNKRQLLLRKQIAEHFIEYFGYDWTFEIVFGDQVLLSEIAEEKYRQLVQGFTVGRHCPSPIPLSQRESYLKFIREGVLSAEVSK